MAKKRLYDIAAVIRSKNSGPFSITLDVLFEAETVYRAVKDSGIICRDTIVKLYQVEPEQITQIVFYDPAQGFKITFDRKISSGTCLDTDVYGAQQHGPLADLAVEIPDGI